MYHRYTDTITHNAIIS